jgi:general secretion pathway protein L
LVTPLHPAGASAGLHDLVHGVKQAWRDMPTWPAFAWMGGEARVRLLHADGSDSLWLSNGVTRRQSPRAKGSSQFVALELPEDLVLRRQFSLPEMADTDVHDAVHLHAQDGSPFASDDLDWGYVSRYGAPGQLDIELALASTRQVAAFIASADDLLLGRKNPLVWVRTPSGQVIEFPSYGGKRVQALGRRKRWLTCGLFATAVALGAAMLATPTVKLRMQAIEANHAYFKMQTQTSGPATQ